MRFLLVTLAACQLAGCAVVDHFRYPTGEDDKQAYEDRMAATSVGMSRADFEALWAGDERGYQVLAVEEATDDGGPLLRYHIGYVVEYMEAGGRDIDTERRDASGPPPPSPGVPEEDDRNRDREREWERERHQQASTDFRKSVYVTAIVVCRDDTVVRIERP